jgi:predicted nucleotidyltransferase
MRHHCHVDLAELRRLRPAILAAAAKRGADDVRVFGSVARGEATASSDVDILVRFAFGRSLSDQAHLIDDLQELLSIHVDVLDEGGLLPRDQHILDEAVAL